MIHFSSLPSLPSFPAPSPCPQSFCQFSFMDFYYAYSLASNFQTKEFFSPDFVIPYMKAFHSFDPQIT